MDKDADAQMYYCFQMKWMQKPNTLHDLNTFLIYIYIKDFYMYSI